MSAAEDVQDIDDGDKKILDALRATESLLHNSVREAIAYFIDYMVERVLLIDISVDSESEAHRVFVTMNDRGLRLGPIDLLKGQILSKIGAAAESHACHSAWSGIINSLRSLDPEEDSLFFRNLLRAKWARTIRGKSKGDAAGDFDHIGDEYHRWFENNTSLLGLNNGDDYAKFVKIELKHFSAIYIYIKNSEELINPDHPHIYFNAARRYGFQAMVLMAPVRSSDYTDTWKAKIGLVARLIDMILTARTIEGKENNYDNLKDISFQLAREIRDLTMDELLTYIKTAWSTYDKIIPILATVKYHKSDRSDILFLLARIACFLEENFPITNRVGFAGYWQRDKGGRTFDIEHLLKEQFDLSALPADHGFFDAKDYADSRNLIGALTLLPRSRNRSLQDKPYREKITAYATENILAQTFCQSFYMNNPNATRYLTNNPGLQISSVTDFKKSDIESRTRFYSEVAKIIWKAPDR